MSDNGESLNNQQSKTQPVEKYLNFTLAAGLLKRPSKQATRRAFKSAQRNLDVPETETDYPERECTRNNVETTELEKYYAPETEVPRPVDQYESYDEYVGETPLVDITPIQFEGKRLHPDVKVFAKCEFFSPGFSIKDRIVLNILKQAENEGNLRSGMTVVSASSGNTGASTAMFCAIRGYQCIVTTCSKCSKEKRDAIEAYGATLMVSPPTAREGDPDHYMNVARRLATENPNSFFDVDQYENQRNPEAHYMTLGPEIWEQTLGKITHFVAAGSTGGTVSGTGKYLKEKAPNVQVILADPTGSIFKVYHRSRKIVPPGKFLVEGVGKGAIPGTLDINVIDSVVEVSDEEAFATCQSMAKKIGICAGGSSGLNVFGAFRVASKMNKPATIVTVLPDLGIKYLSKIYREEWLKSNGIDISASLENYGLDKCWIEEDFFGSPSLSQVTIPESQVCPSAVLGTDHLVRAYRYSGLVGDTPLVDISGLVENRKVKLLAKCEFFNPGFSVEDRAVQFALVMAQRKGVLRAGMSVVAACGVNKGTSLAMFCAINGFTCTVLIPANQDPKYIVAIELFGARVVPVPNGSDSDTPNNNSAWLSKQGILEEDAGFFDLNKFESHLEYSHSDLSHLGQEIWEQTTGKVTHFVAASFSESVMLSTGQHLKQQSRDIQVVFGQGDKANANSGMMDEKFHSFVGESSLGIVDEVVHVTSESASAWARRLCREEGICAGRLSGFNIDAALQVAKVVDNDSVIVTVLPDIGVKDLS